MPHLVLDCTERILELKKPQEIIEEVFETADATGLFERNDIKIRLNPFKHTLVMGGDKDFIHVFANIMQGRTEEQKANLSYEVVRKLNEMFPAVPIISMNVRDFERSSYMNKTML